MQEKDLHSQTIVACIWDFDKTLIRGYMQRPLFAYYKIDESRFWNEVQHLPELYAQRGLKVSSDTVYLNHLLTYVRSGPMRGLNNARLRQLGGQLQFFPGMPDFLQELKDLILSKRDYLSHDITLEHYIISTGLAEIIRGSAVEEHVDDVFGCEFVENPAPPGYHLQEEFDLDVPKEISQIGVMVDNTIKTRFVFEINKGANKIPEVDVNARMRQEDRRIPFENMIYVADGPSDVPVFSVVKKHGGKTFAVHDPENPEEFAQNDRLLQSGRIDAYGPTDYRATSSSSMWIKMHLLNICDRIIRERERAMASRLMEPPRHFHQPTIESPDGGRDPIQGTFLE